MPPAAANRAPLMSAAPKVKKRSAAQIAAGKSFAAAGRAAQASARAAAIKKTGKAPPRSKAQIAATAKFISAGQAALKAKRAGKTPVKPKVKAAVMPPEEILWPGSLWPVGCNDIQPTCAAVAVAAHMQAATGLIMSDDEILKLHELARGPDGAYIEDVLEAVRANWLIFGHGRVKLLTYFRTDEQCLLSGLVVGVKLPHAGHAVLSAPGGMISWGRYMPWQGEPEEAWCLEWGP